jgi:hypothetical protein
MPLSRLAGLLFRNRMLASTNYFFPDPSRNIPRRDEYPPWACLHREGSVDGQIGDPGLLYRLHTRHDIPIAGKGR